MNSFTHYFNGSTTFLSNHPVAFILLIAWIMTWKGLALWKAGRLSHKIWFIILLVANTLGLLEIIYLLFVARKYSVTSETESETIK